jgi:hypothetical protein
MSRAMRYFALALAASPLVTYFVYRLARGLGFLDPPWNKEHEYRRTIAAAMYAFVLFLGIFLFGYANAWPRVWAIFGVVNGLALVLFGAAGISAGWKLWKLRHPRPPPDGGPVGASEAVGDGGDEVARKPLT